MHNIFHSKILILGEYGIIKGSKGFAMPFDMFGGQLSFNPNKQSDKTFIDLGAHIKRSSILKKELNVDKLIEDIDQGLYFDSNIPQGHGLGSSGALSAAIFDRYSSHFSRNTNYDQDEISYVQELLSLIESNFHGKSSGLDPLISFFNKPVMISNKKESEFVEVPDFGGLGHFFLLDTQIQRKTSPLVHQFLKDYSDDKYAAGIQKYINLSDNLLIDILELNQSRFINNFKEMSRVQYLYFEKMIPSTIKEVWLQGLESKNFFLKLCGAGGGGYFIVYAPNGDAPSGHRLIKFP